jgi:hypothetical protein
VAIAYTSGETWEWKLVRRDQPHVTQEAAIDDLYHAIQIDVHNLMGLLTRSYARLKLSELIKDRSRTKWNDLGLRTLELVWKRK